jgi:hypothetical protein
MYYVVHKQENLTQASIHLSIHDHPMAKGHSREAFNQVKSFVEEKGCGTSCCRLIISNKAK